MQKLVVFFGGIPDYAITCMFVLRLPGPAKRLLQSFFRMDALSLKELFASAWGIMKDETVMEELVNTVVQPTQSTWMPSGRSAMDPIILQGILCRVTRQLLRILMDAIRLVTWLETAQEMRVGTRCWCWSILQAKC